MSETPTALVTGATGMLGRAVVARFAAAGVPVRGLSRRERPSSEGVDWFTGDLTTGAGVRRALDGADVLVHLAAAPYRRGYTRAVEVEGTRRLLAAAGDAGIRHVVYTSILGCDQIPWGYFRTKVEAEQVIREGSVPSSILRLGQFHGFVDQAFTALARTGLLLSDRAVLAQPVDTSDVAEQLLSTFRAGASGETAEFAGPEILDLHTAARQWLDATGLRRAILPIRVPGKAGRAFRAGHLTTRSEPRGRRTWRQYLEAKRDMTHS